MYDPVRGTFLTNCPCLQKDHSPAASRADLPVKLLWISISFNQHIK
jgi:hypothetical protein